MGLFLLNTFLFCLSFFIIAVTIMGVLFVGVAIYQWIDEETDIIDYLKEKWQNRKSKIQEKGDAQK